MLWNYIAEEARDLKKSNSRGVIRCLVLLTLGIIHLTASAQSQQWVWLEGTPALSCSGVYGCGEPGVYGTQGVGAVSNVPGSREGAATWIDTSGNLWLFGGIGYDANDSAGLLNDLWQFNPTTQLWTWMGGSSTLPCELPCGQAGVYGTRGQAAAGNLPGARNYAASWTPAPLHRIPPA
jgi:hypothetical protein